MKFDCIVSNAPFDNGLHEKFESKYFELCKGEIVWVSPLSFLLGKKQNKRITLELDKYKTDIEQINGNEYFDAAIQIKGHNPEKTLIKDKYTSRLYSDAAPEHIIPFEILNDENIRDMVIITFARPDKLVYSENVKRHARLFNRVLVLDGSHFNQFADVWQSIYEKFQNLK